MLNQYKMQNELRRINEELALLNCTDKPVKRLLANFGNFLLFSVIDNTTENRGKQVEDMVEVYRASLAETVDWMKGENNERQQKLFEDVDTDSR